MGSRRAKTKSKVINDIDKIEKKKQRNLLLISLLIIFLMTFSIFGIMFQGNNNSSSDNSYEINGFTFSYVSDDVSGYWEITDTPKNQNNLEGMIFYVSPDELNYDYFLSDKSEILDKILNSSSIYLVSDTSLLNETNFNLTKLSDANNVLTSEEEVVLKNIQYQEFGLSNLADLLNQNKILVSRASTVLIENLGLPQLSCDDATEFAPVVEFSFNNESETGISLVNDNCIVISANNDADLLRESEILKYELILN